MAPADHHRHAHFQSDDNEDSGNESSPGLQFQSRRLRPILNQNSTVTSDGATIQPDERPGDVQQAPSKPVPIAAALHNMLDLHRVPSAGGHVRDDSEKDFYTIPSPVNGSPPGNPKRQKVRMNSTPVAVSTPLRVQDGNMQDTLEPVEGLTRGRSQQDHSLQRVSWDSGRQTSLSEKTQGKLVSPAQTRDSDEVPREKHVPGRTGTPARSRKSKYQEWIRELYSSVKSSPRVTWIVPTVTNYSLMKPVIRCAVSAWLGMVFLLINPILRVEGQSAFFSVVVAFIAPPNLPFVQAMEQIIYLWVFVGLAWVWVVICAACISAVRTNDVNESFLAQVEHKYSGLKATNPEQYQRRIVSTCSESGKVRNDDSSSRNTRYSKAHTSKLHQQYFAPFSLPSEPLLW
ncbi:hypothetical protein QFC19_002983 [Naganishia cerealis]|uniref:Uncharacterized protein n=1 Tax=Naganishia cerealis TaxID=610337 RepID=A0ACC2W536_9TREE|nr:hypothetical protein QFC19_002983 [Naganishia cerealis]